jgi:hypothetical protein
MYELKLTALIAKNKDKEKYNGLGLEYGGSVFLQNIGNLPAIPRDNYKHK